MMDKIERFPGIGDQTEILKDVCRKLEFLKENRTLLHTASGPQNAGAGIQIIEIMFSRNTVVIYAYALERAEKQNDILRSMDEFSLTYDIRQKELIIPCVPA